MIIDEVTLHDFGPYRGRQKICLTPRTPRKPVVLIGGMNGGGKTSLLDALQLALYGQRASCSNRGTLAYDSFLGRSINRSALAEEGASVEVALRYPTAEGESRLRVHRSWRDTGKGIREHLDVWRDSALDEALTDAWNERVESILPPRLAHLFFFDGEKIESLADLTRSRALLETALDSLLGLDRVTQLVADLKVLERRKRGELGAGADELKALSQAEAELEEARARGAALTAQCGSVRTDLGQTGKLLRKNEEALRSAGGALVHERGALEASRARLEADLRAARASLQAHAAGSPPLLLVSGLLRRSVKQADVEVAAGAANQVEVVLEDRDRALLEWLGSRMEDELQDEINSFLASDRATWRQRGSAERHLHATAAATEEARAVVRSGLRAVKRSCSRLLREVSKISEELATVDRKLESIPPEDRIAGIVEEGRGLKRKHERLEAELAALEEEHAKASRVVERAERKVERMHDHKVQADFEQEDIGRLIDHSQRARSTLRRFRQRAAGHHIRRISSLALESLQFLLHKDKLVTDLRIDPETCAVELIGSDRQPISAARLSAGERQLLAISLLWGLARASGQVLPTVIDTPLGRLDSRHRHHLVERYFPHASHQVILLSTDEEIDEHHYQSIQKWVGRSYMLEHQSSDDSTVIREGYFWDN